MTNSCLLAVGTIIALAVPGPAAALPNSTVHYRVDDLAADWIIPTRDPSVFRWIIVDVTRRIDLNTGETALSGSAGNGTCSLTRTGELSCAASLSTGWRVLDFEVAPGSTTAAAVLKRKTQRVEVAWTGTQPYAWLPPVSQGPALCEGGSAGTSTRVYVSGMNATAEGRAFGRRVATAAEDDAQRTSENIDHFIEVEDCP